MIGLAVLCISRIKKLAAEYQNALAAAATVAQARHLGVFEKDRLVSRSIRRVFWRAALTAPRLAFEFSRSSKVSLESLVSFSQTSPRDSSTRCAQEALSNVQVVRSFGAETLELQRYVRKIGDADDRDNTKKTNDTSFAIGLQKALLFSVFGMAMQVSLFLGSRALVACFYSAPRVPWRPFRGTFEQVV